MGLGKTVQALALLKTNILRGEKDPVLLICPTSVIENWRREAEHFVPDLSVLIHHGTRRPRGEKFAESIKGRDLVISSYSLLHRDNETFKKAVWSGVILDEAQNIKNPETRQSKAARSIRSKMALCPHRHPGRKPRRRYVVHYGIPDAWPAPKQIKVCQGIYASHTGRRDECPPKR